MIPIYQNEAAWEVLNQLNVPSLENDPKLATTVCSILEQVRSEGDKALRYLAKQYGDPVENDFQLNVSQIEAALSQVSTETRQLFQRAAANIRVFAQSVMQTVKPIVLTHHDIAVGMDWRPVERVACYVPGGRYPLSSTALMTALTAQVAGVSEIAIVSPDLQPETIYAGTLAGINRFYQLGGAQAVAAMAYGTESIPQVDMLIGPGNAYVTEAKRQLQGILGIDMLAGPSEVAIIADAGANPEWVAWDLLAQAEHDPQARAYLLTPSSSLARQTRQALERITSTETHLPDYLKHTATWGGILVFPTLEACAQAVNQIAPEHLELLVADPIALKPNLRHYGALFMGYYTPVPLGDYMAGSNHTLPTTRSARFSGGLNPLVFLRAQSWIYAKTQPHSLLMDTAHFACLEGLNAHAASALVRGI